MDFALNEDQQAIQDMARRFATEQMAPHAAEWDDKKFLPIDVLKEAAALGFAAIYTKSDVGGCELGRLDAALIFEELSTACPSTAAFISIHNMATWMIDSFGSEELRQTYVPSLATMDVIASYCLTEPGAGSDAANLRTSAKREGDDYILNGSKAFISGGGKNGLYVVMARTGGEGAAGISAFVVEADMPGVTFGANEQKLGWNSQPTATVNFDDCRIPARNLIGAEGDGFKFAMKGLDGGRLNIGACSLGGARFCLEAAVDYVKDRKQFGKTIADFQSIQFKVADMATDLEAARLMLHRAAWSVDQNDPNKTQYCAMAKRLATDTGFQVVDDALQLHGGYGYLKDYPVERYFRDLRVHRILEGTNEIMRVIISRSLLKG